METGSYTAKIAGFEGPFGLLLELVEKRKLFINDVSLATVTEDFLGYMNKLGGLGRAEIASFVLVASTLILIKSKSLLPNLSLTTEEEGDIKSLEERLRLYELFTKLGGNVKNMFGEKMIFAPLERKNDVLVFLPDTQITKDSMMNFARNVLGGMPKKVFLPEAEVKKVISIEEMIGKLTDRIQSSIQTSFKSFAGKATTREEKLFVIVGFLAMLELVRNGILDAIQENGFADIIISKQEKSNTNVL
ncbi:MAG: ScpA family protein [Candidatus Nomurabacteria bacterium]|nr:ScpA family protein [Candidatus Nomurabacteria bacterium]